MRIKSDTAYELWITFLDGRQIRLDQDSSVEIADSGLLVLKHANHQVTIYPPNSLVKFKLLKAPRSVAILQSKCLGVSIPSP